jgi:GH18 family chitinase
VLILVQKLTAFAPSTRHHANLYPSKIQTPAEQASSLSEAVRAYINIGFPPSQIVVGLPAYGQAFFQVIDPPPADWTRKGHPGALYYPVAQAQAGKTVQFPQTEIVKKIGEGFKEFWDDESKAGYLYHNDSKVRSAAVLHGKGLKRE